MWAREVSAGYQRWWTSGLTRSSYKWAIRSIVAGGSGPTPAAAALARACSGVFAPGSRPSPHRTSGSNAEPSGPGSRPRARASAAPRRPRGRSRSRHPRTSRRRRMTRRGGCTAGFLVGRLVEASTRLCLAGPHFAGCTGDEWITRHIAGRCQGRVFILTGYSAPESRCDSETCATKHGSGCTARSGLEGTSGAGVESDEKRSSRRQESGSGDIPAGPDAT
jgi:hypothetical protein